MTGATDTADAPDAAELRTLARALVEEQSTMTLATSRDGAPWAAAVYYVRQKAGFYFLSNPETRHIENALESGLASAAIHAPSFDWQEIRGVQMSGGIEHVDGKIEAVKAIAAYLVKFPFTSAFFTPGAALDMAAFEARFRVKLYRFTPTLTYYLDNKIRFGFRGEVELD